MTGANKITKVADLPAWFNLENYSGCKSFTASNWLDNLEYRKRAFENLLSAGYTSRLMSVSRLLSEPHWGLFAFVNQFFPIRNGNPLYIRGSSPMALGLDSTPPPVQSLTFFELACQRETDKRSQSRDGIWESVSVYEHGKTIGENLQLLNNPIGFIKARYSEGYPLRVDLRASDAELLNAFRKWLKTERARQKDTPTRESPHYDVWARNGLLPYLDLKIWACLAKVEITNPVLAKAVQYPRSLDSFGRYAPKQAYKLLNDPMELGRLRVMAALEAE